MRYQEMSRILQDSHQSGIQNLAINPRWSHSRKQCTTESH